MNKPKLIRITTVPISLFSLLKGQLRFMNQYYNVIGISSEGDLLESVNKREGVPVKTVHMTRSITPLKDLKSVWNLYKIFKKEKPLIVHTHTPKAGTVGMLAAKLAKVPLRLHTVAGLPLLEAKGIKRKLLNWVEKTTYGWTTNIYPNSNGLKQIILDEGFCNDQKLKVIGSGSTNGIDTTFFSSFNFTEKEKISFKKNLKIQDEDFIFIFVGRLVSDKGINELVAAFNDVSKAYANVKLLLIGSRESDLDPLKTHTEELIISNPAIICTGFQSDVRLCFAIADVLVFPSYREGFPNVVMQAGAMGLPSIVSNINGCNEIIVNMKNGIIIPPKSISNLISAMLTLLNNKEVFVELKRNARIMIQQRYEQKVVWNALLAEYKRLEYQMSFNV
ncbi:MAG: glycosyltransferase family 4 protein [Ginsengibacter sp.]